MNMNYKQFHFYARQRLLNREPRQLPQAELFERVRYVLRCDADNRTMRDVDGPDGQPCPPPRITDADIAAHLGCTRDEVKEYRRTVFADALRCFVYAPNPATADVHRLIYPLVRHYNMSAEALCRTFGQIQSMVDKNVKYWHEMIRHHRAGAAIGEIVEVMRPTLQRPEPAGYKPPNGMPGGTDVHARIVNWYQLLGMVPNEPLPDCKPLTDRPTTTARAYKPGVRNGTYS